MKKRNYFLLIPIVFLFGMIVLISKLEKDNPPPKAASTQRPTASNPSPTPFIFTSYTPPNISQKPVYKIVMIGDSMTAALGPHGGSLSEYLNTLYKKNEQAPQRIVIDNYAKSSNILAVSDELSKRMTISEYTFEPLLSQDFDLILVESFGYNPLSQFGIENGIKEQNKALDELMKTLITTHPHAAIIFVTTIAPNIENYAKTTQPDTSTDERAKLAKERIAYLENHIAYAKSHNIPMVNIYQKSLTANGDGNIRYINLNDDIHPSFEGIDFIAHEIANYIFDTHILPL